MTDRNYAMEITNAIQNADLQALAAIAIELVGLVQRDEARRGRDRQRKRDIPRKSRNSTESAEIAESSPFSPTPPFTPPTSSTSSSPRVFWTPIEEAKLAARLLTDPGRNALSAVLRRCEDKRAVAAEIGMILDGGRPNVSPRAEHMELALSDYASNGMTEGRFNAAHFRRHVQRAAKPEQQNGNGSNGRGGPGQRVHDKIREALGD